VIVVEEKIARNNRRTTVTTVPNPPPVPTLVRTARRAAIGIAVAIAVASFVGSFAGLADLALHYGISERLVWLWPLTVGGTIAQATVAIIVLAGYPTQARSRRFFWAVLIVGVGVCVGGNVLRALTVGPMPPVLGALIATIVPLSLLATTHGLAILVRFNPEKEN
jgi:hypothetical protein